MAARSVGEDEFPPRQFPDLVRKQGVRLQARAVDVVNKFQKALSQRAMLLREPAERRAVTRIIVLVEGAGRQAVDAEKLDQKKGDPLVDARPNSAVRRVQGIVEVEDPCGDMAKARPQRLIGRQAERGPGNARRHGDTLALSVKLKTPSSGRG